MSYKQRLELDWIGKDEDVFLEPRILLKNIEYSSKTDDENLLIHGDNLLALKALESDYSGRVKCIYIDPPYNTGNAFGTYYDDGLEHSLWLSLMKPRLLLLRSLLKEDGTIWISIDDGEVHYLKVLCDEIFGRSNFVSSIVWQKIHSTKNDAKHLSVNHEYILVYAKDIEKINLNLLERTSAMDARYKNPDNDPRGPWQSGDLVANEERTNGYYDVVGPTGKTFNVPKGKHWVYAKDRMEKMIEEGRIWFGKSGSSFPRKKRYLSEVQQGKKADTIWLSSEVGHNQEGKREVKIFNPKNVFPTPKPERLVERILSIATNEGDIVLDSFAGSGTTGAVAHKMNRKWIMVELGDHAYTHIVPRLRKVILGEDSGGVTQKLNWKGGGGYRFLELAPSLLNKDDRGNWIINDQYNMIQLAEAVCKHEKFKFFPHESVYWKQGYSGEKDFIFVTTQFLTSEHLDRIQEQMQKDETLLICSKAFRVKKEKYKNITLKKIPQMLLGRCEFGRDDYSLNIREVAQEELDMDLDA